MPLFTKAIPNTRPDINRSQTMIRWPELVAMALYAAIFLPGPAPANPHLDSALEATVADSIVAIREGKIPLSCRHLDAACGGWKSGGTLRPQPRLFA
jgi:hypothetical protein